MRQKNNRRQFIRNSSGLFLALPYLPSLLSAEARAAVTAAPKPKRFIGIQFLHGIFPEEWFPWVAPEAVHFNTAVLKSAPYELLSPAADQIRDLDLSKITATMSPSLQNYDELRDKIMIIKGLTGIDGSGHNRTAAFCGYIPVAGLGYLGESIDQVIARKIYDQEPVMRSISLSALDNNTGDWSIRKNGTGFGPSAVYRDAGAIDKLVFSPLRASTSAAAKLQHQQDQQTIIDFLNGDIQRTLTSSAISQGDKTRLQAYVDSVHELQKRQLAAGGIQCKPPEALPSFFDQYGNTKSPVAQGDAIESSYFDTIVNAIKCDISRVFTLSAAADDFDFLGVGGDYHGKCHARDLAHITRVRTYTFDKIAALMKSLMDVEDPETGATYLDNTLIMVASEICPFAHDRTDLNVMLAGNLDGYFKMGRAVSFQNYNEPSWDSSTFGGRPYSRLLYSVLEAYGISPAEANETMGARNGAAHPEQRLTSLGDWQTSLPFLRSRTS